ncbi:hypothetical protein F2P56_008121 [Juglans regia]|uniref:Non-specific lipid-transfer protein n=2 Tax=Juglans regia TaxID=51240 RepID=A0A2I4E4U6_JUGRE|nr:non-specific lipid-transfer protein 3-like [Juglans regia]KAF5476400.1 hypothetical protein F2P56_008121 [Juglans regia]
MMASFVNVFKLGLLLAVVCMVVGAPKGTEAAITCGQVVNYLTPCISYVANGGSVPTTCCSGIKSLFGLARTTGDRQGVCNCLKQAVNGVSYTPYNLNLAAGLPKKCGVNIPYKISPSVDCKSVK